ncbi:MAG: glycoside hydrolase family 36 protein [Tepidiformaceae bacterium]
MANLPWDLWLNPVDLPEGLAAVHEYDAASGRLAVTVRNRSEDTLKPRDLRFWAELDEPAADGWAWLHGRYMQTDALVRNFGAPPEVGYDGRYARAVEHGRRYISREAASVTLLSQGSPALFIGCLRIDRFFFDIEVELNEDESRVRGLGFVFDLDGLELAPGEELELPPILLIDGRDERLLIYRYADEVAAEMSARVPDHVPTGWCSWYYFYNRVSEADVLANLAEMRATSHPADYVQIDDGFQSFTGDWLVPNEKFPSGMKALADAIRTADYRPGLWLAPLVLHEDSAALRAHPDVVLRGDDGEIVFVPTWLGRCALLDCTNPAAEAWLRNTVRTVVHEWGYEYLKLDALSFAARPASTVRYFLPGTTAAANLRRGLEIVREAAGDDTFILGCTCHFGPAVGLVDAMRVGPDVKELWADGPNPSVRHAMRLTLQRNWMHNRWWANDPDCLIVRQTETALSEAEVRFLATGIAMSGGMVVASDNLPKLTPERRNMALALFPSPGVAGEAYEVSDGPVPFAWRSDLGEGRGLVGFLNWSDSPRWVVAGEYLRPGEVAFDVWNARLLGMGDTLLQPHEGALWQVSARAKTPRVVGDSASLTYGTLFQRPVSGRIQVRNDLSRPRVIAIEARGQVFEVELHPGEMRWFD